MADQKRLNRPFSESDFDEWLQLALTRQPSLDHRLLERACDFARTQCTITPTQHNTAQLGLAIADILLDMKCDSHMLTAAIILPTTIHQDIAKDVLTDTFNADISHLIAGVAKMEATELTQDPNQQHDKQHIDNLRKMMLAIVDDARIVLLKLARRVVRLHSFKEASESDKRQLAQQTMDLYAPLANRLGMGQLKWQLEDLSFRYLSPEEYKKLSKSLKLRREERDQFINQMIAKLIMLLHGEGIRNINVTGRSKHIYSIHRKIERKKVGFTEIYDASALRILVPEIKDCYTTLGIVHSQWPPIKEEFDDYVSQPKANGYQSIHTAVTCDNTINVEIQIRTHSMHEVSELGVAAHWKYKEGDQGKASYEDKIATLRQVISWQQDLSTDDMAEQQANYADVFEDRVYVFTPQGDVYDLPQGSTSLDFAYHIHTQVGNRCKGAKINGKLEPLSKPLKTGDRVQISTGKEDHPSLDWLNPSAGYITTSHARNKIKAWFRKQNLQRHLEVGEEIWSKARKKAHCPKNAINTVYESFNLKSSKELIAAIGSGEVHITTVINHIQELESDQDKEKPEPKDIPDVIATTTHKKQRRSHCVIEGVDNMLTQLARCCKPIPGDDIVGYITKGRGITIHKENCGNVKYALQQQPERMTVVTWGESAIANYLLGLYIEASDRPELIRDITSVIAKNNCSMLGLSTHVDKLTDRAHIDFTIEVLQQTTVKEIIQALQNIPDVTKVERK